MGIINLIKISVVFAFICTIVGNAFAAELDLPNDTPGIRGKSYTFPCKKRINNIDDVECIHVIVPDSDAHKTFLSTKGLNAKEQHESTIVSAGNLYFPTNGAQPTSREAAEYSCANIDNRENSPITEWYMKMFGVIPFQNTGNPANDYIKAGLTGHSFDFNETKIVDLSNFPLEKQWTFIGVFRKIAANPVGRKLLYRILLEIRRLENAKPKVTGYSQTDDPIDKRIQCCSISVKIGQSHTFSHGSGIIEFNDDTGAVAKNNFSTVIGEKLTQSNGNKYFSGRDFSSYKDKSIVLIQEKQAKPLEISLFHELAHWFHFLKNQKRFILESNASNRNLLVEHEAATLGRYYWKDLHPHDIEREKISGAQWYDRENRISFEEIRNILGVPHTIVGFENGDEISENEYRNNLNLPLRFGHRNIGFIEDIEVIRKIPHYDDRHSKQGELGGNLEQFKNGLGNSFMLP